MLRSVHASLALRVGGVLLALMVGLPAQAVSACLVPHAAHEVEAESAVVSHHVQASEAAHTGGHPGHSAMSGGHHADQPSDQGEPHCDDDCDAECASSSAATVVAQGPSNEATALGGNAIPWLDAAPDPDARGLMRPPRIS